MPQLLFVLLVFTIVVGCGAEENAPSSPSFGDAEPLERSRSPADAGDGHQTDESDTSDSDIERSASGSVSNDEHDASDCQSIAAWGERGASVMQRREGTYTSLGGLIKTRFDATVSGSIAFEYQSKLLTENRDFSVESERSRGREQVEGHLEPFWGTVSFGAIPTLTEGACNLEFMTVTNNMRNRVVVSTLSKPIPHMALSTPTYLDGIVDDRGLLFLTVEALVSGVGENSVEIAGKIQIEDIEPRLTHEAVDGPIEILAEHAYRITYGFGEETLSIGLPHTVEGYFDDGGWKALRYDFGDPGGSFVFVKSAN